MSGELRTFYLSNPEDMRILTADSGALYSNIQGTAEGTSYNVIYQDDSERDFQTEIEKLLVDFEKSLSVYDETSLISRINRNETNEPDQYFSEVFARAKEIYTLTEGAFDMSAEPLFQAWGFSNGSRNIPDDSYIEKLKQRMGMDKIALQGGCIIKETPDIILNANAIAKGYSTDIVARFLDDRNCQDYMVEIGGEIRMKGENLKGEAWRIGIDRPVDNNLIPGQDLQVILEITDKGVATSGNYRQFYVEDGKKIAHTIDPSTGYPAKHNLLSATVVADDAMTADAFATAFLVRGMEKSAEWLEKYHFIDALFICNEEEGYKVYCSQGMEKYIAEIR